MLGNPRLLDELIRFDRENMDEKIITTLGAFLGDPHNEKNLDNKVVESASSACGTVLAWIKGIHNFFWVHKKVKPKK